MRDFCSGAYSRMLTDRGTEFCGTSQAHEYELYLAVEDIDHSRTKTKSPQTNASARASIALCSAGLPGGVPQEDLPGNR